MLKVAGSPIFGASGYFFVQEKGIMVTPQRDEQDYSISGSDEPGGAGLDEEDLDALDALDDEDLGLPDDSGDDLPYQPTFEDQLQQREAQINQRERAFVEAQRINQLGQHVQGFFKKQYQQYYQGLTQIGHSQDEAQALAQALAKKDAESGLYAYKDKLTLERLVAAEEGVPQELFAGDWDEGTMRQRAQYFKSTGGPETAQLQQRVAQLEQQLRHQMPGGKAPQYNQPGSGGRGGTGSYVNKLKSGKPLPSSREIDRITSRYLRG